MIESVNNMGIGKVAGGGVSPASPAGSSGGASFAETLKNSIDEVARLQQDASKAVENLATGQTDNMAGVMTAVEKSDLAFKTLLTIRNKLMEAYDEIKSMQV